MFTQEMEKSMWTIILTAVSKMKDFLRSQVVTYTVKVIISRELCKIEMLLLHQ